MPDRRLSERNHELKLVGSGHNLTLLAVTVIDLYRIFKAKSLTAGGERHTYLIVKACHTDDGASCMDYRLVEIR